MILVGVRNITLRRKGWTELPVELPTSGLQTSLSDSPLEVFRRIEFRLRLPTGRWRGIPTSEARARARARARDRDRARARDRDRARARGQTQC